MAKVRTSMGTEVDEITIEQRREYNLRVLEIVDDILDTLTSSCQVEWVQHESKNKITSFWVVISVWWDRHAGTDPSALGKVIELANIHGAKVGTGSDGSIKIYPKHFS